MLRRIVRSLLEKLRGEISTPKLIRMGMTVGRNFRRMQNCSFDVSHCWLVSIGDDVTFSTDVRLITHDASTKGPLGYAKIGRIRIGSNVFVGSRSVILLNVAIGNNVIIGAGSIVTKDIPDNSVAVGCPARVISSYEEYIERNGELMIGSHRFDENYTVRGSITERMKEEMREKLEKGIAFVK